jgi:hypothetical protein
MQATGSYLVDLTTPPQGTVSPSDRLPLAVGYWLATVLVAAELGLGGVWDIARVPYVRDLVVGLGYPSYFLEAGRCWARSSCSSRAGRCSRNGPMRAPSGQPPDSCGVNGVVSDDRPR